MRSVDAHFNVWVAGACLLGCTSMMGIDGEYTLEQSKGASGGTSGGRGPVDAQNGGSSTGGSVVSGGAASSSGGVQPPGGSAGTGGEDATGGGATATGGAGGATAAGGAGGAVTECPLGQKLCTVNDEELCVQPDPSVGCGPTSCEQCKPPPNGFGMCEGTECSFGCFENYVRSGSACVAVAPPDAGSTGTGGRPTTCRMDSDCAPCSGEIQGCCSLVPLGRCGCNFVWCVPTPP